MSQTAPNRPAISSHALAKWRLIGAYWLAQAVFVVLFTTIWAAQADTVNGQAGRALGSFDLDRMFRPWSDPEFWLLMVAAIGGLVLLQTVIVWPVRRPRPRRERGWALWLSLGTGALVGTALAAALMAALFTLPEIIDVSLPHEVGIALRWAFGASCVVSYILGAALLHRFSRRKLDAGSRHEEALAKIAATLFVGTLVEGAAIMPLDVMFRRKNDCYCFAGTFWAYTLLVAAGLVTLGPAIFLPMLAAPAEAVVRGRV